MAAGDVRVLRALDPAERYFWLLGHFTSVNAVLVAELSRRVDPDAVVRALGALQRRHPLLRARIEVVDSEPAFVEVTGAIPLSVLTLGRGESTPIPLLMECSYEAPPCPVARCVYLPVEGEQRSSLVLVVHHAMMDGSAAMNLLQQLTRLVDAGGEGDGLAPGALPPPLHERFPAPLQSPRAVVDVLSQVRAERAGQAAPSPFPFHAREVTDRVARYDKLVLDGDAARGLVARSRAAGVSVTGTIGAALLEATAALFEDHEARSIYLASATDLRPRVEPPLPADDVMLAIGMLCTPFVVSEESRDTLAGDIGRQVTREVARGESHLFYRFARTGTFAPTDAGIGSFRAWVAESPQNITLSNLGVVGDTEDPPWVESLHALMVPGPNQLAFVCATTYRGRIVLNVSTDAAKLPPAFADRLVAGIGERLGARRVESSVADGSVVSPWPGTGVPMPVDCAPS